MNTYYGCGILKDIPYIIDNPGDFQIQDLGQNNPDRYIYQGDSIKYELDSELVVLYDTLQNLFLKVVIFTMLIWICCLCGLSMLDKILILT